MSGGKCGGTNRQGGPCGNPPGFKTDHPGYGNCAYHGGATSNGRTYAAKEMAIAEVSKLGVAVETDPHDALSQCVAIFAGQVAFLAGRVNEIKDADATAGGELAPLARALNASTETLARISKMAIDAGVAERQVQLNELVVERLAGAIHAALAEVELTPDQQAQLQGSMSRHLASLDDIATRELIA